MEKKPSLARRKFLTGTATVVGGVGVACAITPFLSSWKPSKRAQAAGSPITVDVSKLADGQLMTVEWRGRPIWIVRRNSEQLASLDKVTDLLVDPDSKNSDQPTFAQNEYRSSNPEYLLLVGLCTHLGCIPLFRPTRGDAEIGDDWEGGFFCPCHGSKFDLAGRVFKNVPAPDNMGVPPYRFTSATEIIIGESEKVS